MLRMVREGAGVLFATPGRLAGFHEHLAKLLRNVRCIVLDEADRLLDGNYDEKADLFPTGLILCQLLTGIHPLFPKASEWGMDLPQLHERICQKGDVEYPASVWG